MSNENNEVTGLSIEGRSSDWDDVPSYKQTPYPDPAEHYIAGPSDRFIDLRTMRYGLFVSDMQDIILNRSYTTQEGSVSFGTIINSEFLVKRDFAKMFLTDQPAGRWYEITPKQAEDGRWYQTWEEYIPSQEEINSQYEVDRRACYDEIKATLGRYMDGGVQVDFGGETGVLHLQIRDTDRINMLGLKDEADDLVKDGKGDEVLILRTSENINVEIMAEDFVKLTRGYRNVYKAMMAWSWNWSDQVRVLQVGDAFPEIPATIDLETIVIADL